MTQPEIHFSVDIETAGPYPAEYALLSIGACLVGDPETTFYCELRPDRTKIDPEAMSVHGLAFETLLSHGQPPADAMAAFASWVERHSPGSTRPVFVALNAAFDWMFISDYFHRYLGRNPFGHNALDIKAYYMGLRRISAVGLVKETIDRDYPRSGPLTHNALQDAIDQAALFDRMLQNVQKEQT